MTAGPLIVIVGETASGKSGVALEVARQVNGAIICADSRTMYTGMDIGTAKPTRAEQEMVPHYGLDLVSPDQTYTVAAFKRYFEEILPKIYKKKKIPVLVGGTGLYIDAILYNYSFNFLGNSELRKQLANLSVEELQEILANRGIELPDNAKNPRHLIRAIETGGKKGDKQKLRQNTQIYGLKKENTILRELIVNRVETMLNQGLEDEVKGLVERYGWQAPGLNAIGYREWQAYFRGEQTLEETKDLIVRNTVGLAKRQRTWFRRNNSIQWLVNRGDNSEPATYIVNNLDY